MSVHLYYSSLALSTPSRAIQYDEALISASKGHKVYLLYCNGAMSQCFCNMSGDKVQCRVCKDNYTKEKRLFGDRIEFIAEDLLINDKQKQAIDNINFEYNSIQDIKNLKYDSANIGLSSLSNYISYTRNMYPLMDDNFKSYFDEILRNAVVTTIVTKDSINYFKPDHIFLYNGRLAENRSVWEMAEKHNVAYTTIEALYGVDRNFKMYVPQNIPHSIEFNTECINNYWDCSEKSDEEKILIGSSFFERRRNALYTNDKVYTVSQRKGLLPNNWDATKKNIVIFNSSEDEFASLGDQYDHYMLFESQIEGIKQVKALYEGDSSIHFTLRIHPNLSDIKYSYVTELFDLSSDNLTIIAGNSPISSYTLLDCADTVIVFGSTIGIESVFWNKPTILLAGALYYHLGGCYIPKSLNELREMLSEQLKPKDRMAAIKYSFFMLDERDNYYTFVNFDWDNWKVPLWGKNIQLSNWQRILGSRRLFLLTVFMKKLFLKSWYGICSGGRYKFQVPYSEQIKKQS